MSNLTITRSLRPDVEAAFRHLEGGLAHVASVLADEALEAMRAFVETYGGARTPTCQIEPVDCDGVASAWVRANGADPDKRMLYLHGGGWMAGSIQSHAAIAHAISAASGCSLLLPNYRLAPEHPFPAALDDCRTAWRWISENGPTGRGLATELAIGGDSAGGNLCAALIIAETRAAGVLPRRAILLSPVLDTQWTPDERGRAIRDPVVSAEGLAAAIAAYVPAPSPEQLALVSPATASTEDLEQFPPTLIMFSDCEFLATSAERFAGRLKAISREAHVSIYADVPHVWPAFFDLPESKAAVSEIGAFLKL